MTNGQDTSWLCCKHVKPDHDRRCQYYQGNTANTKQVGGDHYRNVIQHWDWVASNELDYFQGQITKYVARWKKKGGLQDLEKAKHFLEKYIELNKSP